jgi:hypothetical protein
MKMLSVVAELFHENGKTDVPKLTVAFDNFENAPRNWALPSFKVGDS